MNDEIAADLTVITYCAAALLSLLLKEVREKRRQMMTAAEMQALARRLFRSRRTCAVLAASALFTATYQTVTVFLN